jgi:DNA-binding response OmpR family regulator
MRVLIVEDDEGLTRLMAQLLSEAHINADIAYDGDTGLELALQGLYDVAIIDWMVPGRDGPALCRAIRAARLPLPLMMLTARDQVDDRVIGLDSGADDYLIKPFAPKELLARVRALGRRVVDAHHDGHLLRHSDLTLDLRAHTAQLGERLLELTPTEWHLLECLMRHPGQALTRQQLLDHVWSYDWGVQITIVDVYISYLRRKLAAAGERDLIQTVRGVGYRLAPAVGQLAPVAGRRR